MDTYYIGDIEVLRINETTNLEEAKKVYTLYNYYLFLSGYFNSVFLDGFKTIFNNITQLSVQNEKEEENDFLYGLSKLKKLQLSTLFTEVDFSKVNKLSELKIQWNKVNIINLNQQTDLKHLFLSYVHEKNLECISDLLNITTLSVKDAKCMSLNGVGKLRNIKALYIGGFQKLTDVSDLVTLEKLEYLEFDGCPKMVDFSPLKKLINLKALIIADCKKLSSIIFVKDMPILTQLTISGTTVINDLDLLPAEKVINVLVNNKKYNARFEPPTCNENLFFFSKYIDD